MSAAGERLKSRYSGLGRVRVVVPQLEDVVPTDSRGEPAVYAKPFTLRDSTELGEWIRTDNPEGFARVVLLKAEDEQGARIFDIGDLGALTQCCEAHVISNLAQRLMASLEFEGELGK